MGRPLNKRYFGPPTDGGDEIKVQFYDGSSSVNGWIVKQLGSKKFRVTDGTTTKDCFLVNKASGALAADEMSITVDDNGTPKQVTKITAHLAQLEGTGAKIKWDFTGTGTTVEMEEAGGDIIAVTAAVDGTQYEIITAGDTDFTTFGAADSNVGTVFTMANAPGTGTGTVRATAYTADDFENDDATT